MEVTTEEVIVVAVAVTEGPAMAEEEDPGTIRSWIWGPEEDGVQKSETKKRIIAFEPFLYFKENYFESNIHVPKDNTKPDRCARFVFYLRRYDERSRDYQSCCCNIFLTFSFLGRFLK